MIITDKADFAVEIADEPPRRVGRRWLSLDEQPHIARADAIVGWRIWWLLADRGHWGMAGAELATLQNGATAWVASPAACEPDANLGDWYGHQRLTRAQRDHPDHPTPFGPCRLPLSRSCCSQTGLIARGRITALISTSARQSELQHSPPGVTPTKYPDTPHTLTSEVSHSFFLSQVRVAIACWS